MVQVVRMSPFEGLLHGKGFTGISTLPQQDTLGTTLLLANDSRSGGRETQVIIKVLAYRSCSEQRCALRELFPMRQAHSTGSCPHIVQLLEVVTLGGFLCLVMPYMIGGDLCKLLLRHQRGLGQATARLYLTDAANGLLHLHSRSIAHGDVSLENLVLSMSTMSGRSGPMASLIDFGAALIMPAGDTPYVYRGKVSYCPPEVYHSARARAAAARTNSLPVAASANLYIIDPYKVDVWCLGVCLYGMLTGRQLYTTTTDCAYRWLTEGRAADLLRYHRAAYKLPLPPLACDLVAAMLNPDPVYRITMQQVLEHPWVVVAPSPQP